MKNIFAFIVVIAVSSSALAQESSCGKAAGGILRLNPRNFPHGVDLGAEPSRLGIILSPRVWFSHSSAVRTVCSFYTVDNGHYLPYKGVLPPGAVFEVWANNGYNTFAVESHEVPEVTRISCENASEATAPSLTIDDLADILLLEKK